MTRFLLHAIHKCHNLLIVKHFQDVAISDNGELYATISNDKSMKIFDVVNFGYYDFLMNLFY